MVITGAAAIVAVLRFLIGAADIEVTPAGTVTPIGPSPGGTGNGRGSPSV